MPDGTKTNYSPHTITVDTPNRKSTVIRKSDVAIDIEIIKEEPRLTEVVACKTVGKYKRNRARNRNFYLDEQKQKEKKAQEEKAKSQQGPFQSGRYQQGPAQWSNDPINQANTSARKQRHKPRKGTTGSPKRKPQQPRKRTNTPKAASQFDTKSKQAAQAQSKLEQARRRQRRSSSFISTDLEQWNNSDTVEVINLLSDSTQQSPILPKRLHDSKKPGPKIGGQDSPETAGTTTRPRKNPTTTHSEQPTNM